MRKGSGCLSVIIIIICVVICAVLVGKMLGRGNDEDAAAAQEQNSTSAAQRSEGIDINTDADDGSIVVTVTQEKMRELIQNSLDEKFPLQLDELLIHDTGIIEASGSLERDVFVNFVETHNSGLGKAELFLLKFAPENMDFNASFEASYHPATGKMELTPEKIKVEEFSIPVSVFPDALNDKFSLAMNDYASTLGYTVRSVAIYEGYITLYIE